MRVPRVAYFPDSFHEVNGVAHTSRNFLAYAQRHALPFLCVRAGTREISFEQVGELRTLELRRSRGSVRMEKDLEFDTLFWRHGGAIRQELERFRPDVIHITGPSELGMFGAYFAWEMGVPLAASWHTNLHEYAARRMGWLTGRMLESRGAMIEDGVVAGALWATSQFYKLARVLFAPNGELCRMLEKTTGRPCFLMQRGVDTEWFSPAHRTREAGDRTVVLGYVGRLSVEKNVALLARGEPAVVTPDGGPKFIVRDGETGFVTVDDHFAEAVAELVRDRGRLAAMRLKAREYALGCSWDAVFDRVYAGYETALG